MEKLVALIVQTAVFVLVTAPLTAWLLRRMKGERATRSLNRFTVRASQTVRTVCAVGAVAFELLFAAVTVYNGLRFGDWGLEFIALGNAFAVFLLAVWAAMAVRRLDVDGDELRYRTSLGRRRRASFADIDRVTSSGGRSIVTVFVGGARFATLSGDDVCMGNFLRRLEQEGIEVTAASGGPVTLGALVFSAAKPLLCVGMGIGAFMLVGFAALVLVGAFPPVMLLVGLALALLVVVVMGAVPLGLSMRGVLLAKRQERELGRSFAHEMAERGVCGEEHADGDWFVGTGAGRVVVVCRDWVKRVGAPERSDGGVRCAVISKGGDKVLVYADDSTLKELRAWFRGETDGLVS